MSRAGAAPSPESRPHARRGLPLAAKLAAATAALVAVNTLGFGLLLAGFLEDTVRSEVQLAALDAARSAAMVDLDALSAYFGTEDQGLSRDEMQAKVDAMSPFEFRRYDGDEQRKQQIVWNRGRLARLVGADSRILAAELFRWEGGARGALLAASYAPPAEGGATHEGGVTTTEFAPLAARPPLQRGTGVAQEGWLTIGRERWRVIRGSHPLVDRHGVQEGEIAVHLHAAAIEQATSSFQFRLAYAGLLFVLLGAGFSWLLGLRITRPLRQLQEDIRIVASGDLEHHTRAHSHDEVGQLAVSFDALTRTLGQAREAERVVAASRRELAVAAEVSASLFPKRLPSLAGWTLSSLHDTSGSPGGGSYDVFAMPGGRQGFLLAEASGGGVPAALVAAVARTTLRLLAEREADPGAVLRAANARLSPELRRGMYVAALLVVLEPATGRLVLANAGHAPLLHHHKRQDGLESVLTEGIALGFDEGPVFDQTLKVAEITLEPGDTAVLYAGAVAALADPDGQPLGERRLLALVKRELGLGGDRLLERITATLRRFHGADLGPEVTWLSFGRRA